jgi:hypothetical protein
LFARRFLRSPMRWKSLSPILPVALVTGHSATSLQSWSHAQWCTDQSLYNSDLRIFFVGTVLGHDDKCSSSSREEALRSLEHTWG